jgi:8-oxo-dGTP pyrophosphatase MutT (NUDIX family)
MNGDGFVTLPDGSLRWGRYGAAGVLARAGAQYFVAQRSLHCHQGGTWGVPGGALHSDETPLDGALREFAEEIGVSLSELDHEVVHIHEHDELGWSYWTVVLELPSPFDLPTQLHWETAAAAWVTLDELAGLDLHPGFRAALLRLELLAA